MQTRDELLYEFVFVMARPLRVKSPLGVTTGGLLPIGYTVYFYIEFKLRYLKTLKLFSIRVKELFEPLVLKQKKKKAEGFLLLLKAFSWETDFWVTVGNFTVKHVKLGIEICI